MTNLVFDFSNMLHRSMFIVGGFGKNGYTFDSQYELDQLMRKLTTDIVSTIRQINPSRVIFTSDTKSWRKDIEIEENEGNISKISPKTLKTADQLRIGKPKRSANGSTTCICRPRATESWDSDLLKNPSNC